MQYIGDSSAKNPISYAIAGFSPRRVYAAMGLASA
jgi:hypothetical protein